MHPALPPSTLPLSNGDPPLCPLPDWHALLSDQTSHSHLGCRPQHRLDSAGMEQNRAVVVLVLLIIFFFPDTSTPPDHRARIALEQYRLDVLRNSTFGYPGNTTGL